MEQKRGRKQKEEKEKGVEKEKGGEKEVYEVEAEDGVVFGGVMIKRYYVPRDEDDSHYIKSFPSSGHDEEILAFFKTFGFVVVRDVLSPADCQATISDMFNFLEKENNGFDRNDIATWNAWPRSGMEKHGMPTREPVFTKPALMNRQNPNVHHVFSLLLGSENLLVSHDRYGLLRPTKQVVIGGQVVDKPEWKTAGGLHLDMNPWGYRRDHNKAAETLASLQYGPKHMNHFIFENNQVHASSQGGLHLQAVLNLEDNYEEDGGFACVPGFVHHFAEWTEANEGSQWNTTAEERNSLPFQSSESINQLGIRIPLRAGSIVVWDQRTPHGGFPNNSSRMRCAQFIRMFSAEDPPLHPARKAARSATVRNMVKAAKFETHLTPLGKSLFGLDETGRGNVRVATPAAGRGADKGKKGPRNKRL